MRTRTKAFLGLSLIGLAGLCAGQIRAWAADNAGFPIGLDAVQAAPESHKVLFENALVRVLEVTVPANGKTEPMHHHRWPGFFLDWDIGGKTPHIRYHQPGGVVHEQPGAETPRHPGRWVVHWMEPEPLHAIETVDYWPEPGDLPSLRVEIKVAK
jgi:hypothetical protein